ncbi:MAG: hypothetical protein IJK43_10225 [Prevotella sp.]|nr:hypothetical protein [Prevotella sp.]
MITIRIRFIREISGRKMLLPLLLMAMTANAQELNTRTLGQQWMDSVCQIVRLTPIVFAHEVPLIVDDHPPKTLPPAPPCMEGSNMPLSADTAERLSTPLHTGRGRGEGPQSLMTARRGAKNEVDLSPFRCGPFWVPDPPPLFDDSYCSFYSDCSLGQVFVESFVEGVVEGVLDAVFSKPKKSGKKVKKRIVDY